MLDTGRRGGNVGGRRASTASSPSAFFGLRRDRPAGACSSPGKAELTPPWLLDTR